MFVCRWLAGPTQLAAIVVTQTIPRALRLNAPPVWLEAEGARRSAATIGSITAAATRFIVGKLDQVALAAGLQEQAFGCRQRRLQALARQFTLSWSVVPQRDHELVRAETPIMWIRCIDMRSDPSIEFLHQPSDRTAWWPLSVGPAVAGRDLDRHHREAPLRLSRQRRRGNRIRTLDGANARPGGEHERPGQGALGRKFV